MLGAFIGGFIGGAIIGSLGRSSSGTTVAHQNQSNQLIEYHKYREKLRQKEIQYDNDAIYKLYMDRITHCPKCGKKIERKMLKICDPSSYKNLYKIVVCCDCQREISKVEDNLDGNFEKNVANESVRLVEKIRGKVDYDDVRRKFMDEKLKKKEEVEKHYGKIP